MICKINRHNTSDLIKELKEIASSDTNKHTVETINLAEKKLQKLINTI